MQPGGTLCSWAATSIPHTWGCDPYYFKCYDGINYVPLNGRRIQYASQEHTMDIDPSLPIMNLTDIKACTRMDFYLWQFCEILILEIYQSDFLNLPKVRNQFLKPAKMYSVVRAR